MTAREQILAEFKTALDTVTALKGVHRNRRQAISREKSPAVIIDPVNDRPTRNAVGRLTWELTVSLTLITRSMDPEADDAVIEAIHLAVMGSTGISSKVVDIRPLNMEFDYSDADMDVGKYGISFLVIYQTTENDLSSI